MPSTQKLTRTFILVGLAVGICLNGWGGVGQLASSATRTGCVMMWYCTSCDNWLGRAGSQRSVGCMSAQCGLMCVQQRRQRRRQQQHAEPCDRPAHCCQLSAPSQSNQKLLRHSTPACLLQVPQLACCDQQQPPNMWCSLYQRTCSSTQPPLACFKFFSFFSAASEQAGGLFTADTPALLQSAKSVANAPSARVIGGRVRGAL